MEKSVKMSKIPSKFIILDFKKSIKSLSCAHQAVLPIIKIKITNIIQSTDKNVDYLKTWKMNMMRFGTKLFKLIETMYDKPVSWSD